MFSAQSIKYTFIFWRRKLEHLAHRVLYKSRRLIFQVFCIHNPAATLQISLEEKPGSKARVSDHELSYCEYCLVQYYFGVEPRARKDYLDRVPEFMTMRHHKVVGRNLKQSNLELRGWLATVDFRAVCSRESKPDLRPALA